MANKTKILSDLSKIALDAMSSLSGLKKEIETIVKLRVEKVINKIDLVKRDEFEALKKVVQKLANEHESLKQKTKRTNLAFKKKKKRRKSKK